MHSRTVNTKDEAARKPPPPDLNGVPFSAPPIANPKPITVNVFYKRVRRGAQEQPSEVSCLLAAVFAGLRD